MIGRMLPDRQLDLFAAVGQTATIIVPVPAQ
jgi:hypothetical protein